MKRYAMAVAAFGLLLVVAGGSRVHAEDDAPAAASETPDKTTKAKPSKADADKGPFEITITAKDETETFDNTARALTELRKVVSRTRRSQDEADDFKAVLSFNGGQYEFGDPKDTQAACMAVADAVRRVNKAKIDVSEIGTIAIVEPKVEIAEAPLDGKGKGRQNKQQGPAIDPKVQAGIFAIQQRISKAVFEEVRKRRGAPLEQAQVQQIVKREVEKGEAEGLIPAEVAKAALAGQEANKLAAAADPKTAELDAIRDSLEQAFSKAKAPAGEKDEAEEKPGDSSKP